MNKRDRFETEFKFSEKLLARDGRAPDYYGNPIVQATWEGWKRHASICNDLDTRIMDWLQSHAGGVNIGKTLGGQYWARDQDGQSANGLTLREAISNLMSAVPMPTVQILSQ